LYPSARCTPFGDKALRVEIGNVVDPEVNARVHALCEAITKSQLSGISECVPTYRALLVIYDPAKVSYKALISTVKNLDETSRARAPKKKIRRAIIPVAYGGDFGPDITYVSQYHNLKDSDIIRIHSGYDYMVYMIGFIAGFPYMGKLANEIATPRLDTPRIRVPEGSVGIAEDQTGIYPRQAPGGWQIIGRTPIKLFDPLWQPPSLLQPSDTVRFKPISADEFWQIHASASKAKYDLFTQG
jgi:KipI family sensor histidine kinase inhibitor